METNVERDAHPRVVLGRLPSVFTRFDGVYPFIRFLFQLPGTGECILSAWNILTTPSPKLCLHTILMGAGRSRASKEERKMELTVVYDFLEKFGLGWVRLGWVRLG
jgi:hypothetical protein